jgi:hypothetical protein
MSNAGEQPPVPNDVGPDESGEGPRWMKKLNGRLYKVFGPADVKLDSLNAPDAAAGERPPTHSQMSRLEPVVKESKRRHRG